MHLHELDYLFWVLPWCGVIHFFRNDLCHRGVLWSRTVRQWVHSLSVNCRVIWLEVVSTEGVYRFSERKSCWRNVLRSRDCDGKSRTFEHIHQLETTIGTVRKLRYFLRRYENWADPFSVMLTRRAMHFQTESASGCRSHRLLKALSFTSLVFSVNLTTNLYLFTKNVKTVRGRIWALLKE